MFKKDIRDSHYDAIIIFQRKLIKLEKKFPSCSLNHHYLTYNLIHQGSISPIRLLKNESHLGLTVVIFFVK